MSARDDLATALIGLLTRDGWTQYRDQPAAAQSVVRGEWMPHLTPLLDAMGAEAAAEALEQAAEATIRPNESMRSHLRVLASSRRAAVNPSKEQQP